LPRVTTATDAFFGLINQCDSLKKIIEAQAAELGMDPAFPDSPETWAVRKTIKDPPWLDLTVPGKKPRFEPT